MDIYQIAVAELAAARSRVQEMEAFLRIYQTLNASRSDEPAAMALFTPADAAPLPPAPSMVTPKAERKTGTLKEAIENAAVALLRDKVYRQTPIVLRELENQGIEFRAADKQTQLSSILSRRKDLFRNDRKLGWTTVTTEETKEPSDVDASDGSEVHLPLNQLPSEGSPELQGN